MQNEVDAIGELSVDFLAADEGIVTGDALVILVLMLHVDFHTENAAQEHCGPLALVPEDGDQLV